MVSLPGTRNPSYSHGHNMRGERSSEYNIWSGVKSRILNTNHKLFPYYGGRGLSMSPEWAADFKAFLRDVGLRPSATHSLDRIDNNERYYIWNVRWATKTEQGRNKRNNILITYDGDVRCLKEWCELLNQPYKRVWRRMKQDGWTFEDAMFTLPNQGR